MLKILKFTIVFILIFAWVFGYPPVYENFWRARIWQKPAIPPEIKEVQATTINILPNAIHANDTTTELISEITGDDSTVDPDRLSKVTAADNTYTVDGGGKIMQLDTFDVSSIPDGSTISAAVLHLQYGAEDGYTGTNYVRYDNGAGLTNTTILPTDITGWSADLTYDLYAQGVDTKTELQNVDIEFTNNDPPAADAIHFDYVWITVTYTSPPNVDQDSYRWRNDDGSESTATWKAIANTAISNVNVGSDAELIRLRFLIQETANVSFALDSRIEFSSDATSCTTGTWTVMDTATTAWRVTDSTNITNDAATTQQLGAGTFTAGSILDISNPDPTAITIQNNETEVEFAFKGLGVSYSTTYYFRITDNGTLLNTYTNCAQATTESAPAPTLTFSISDYSIGFGTLSASAARYATGTDGSDTEVEAHNLQASTNATNGYIITVDGNTLTSGSFTINAIGCTNTASNPGTEQFGLRMTATGGNGTVTAPYAAAGFAFCTTDFPDQVASDPDGDDISTTYSVRYIANIQSVTEAGNYTATLTYVATGTF